MDRQVIVSCQLTPRILLALKGYLKGWKGDTTTKSGLGFVYNSDGSKQPLVWVFNSSHEAPALAKALGKDQPLIAFRSLHNIISPWKRTIIDERQLASIYSRDLKDIISTGKCYVGGNCQGAPIAAAVAAEFLHLGGRVLGFVSMEYNDFSPLPVNALLLYGARSYNFNPFLQFASSPLLFWEAKFPSYSYHFLSGLHGSYFLPENITELKRYINILTNRVPDLSYPKGYECDLKVPASVRASSSTVLGFKSLKIPSPDAMMLVCWNNSSGERSGFPVSYLAPVDFGADLEANFSLHAPGKRGEWFLNVFLCGLGMGPLAWEQDSRRLYCVEVV